MLKVFEIVDYNGIRKEFIVATDSRQALCLYLLNHEELTDMMLWKSVDYASSWRLAEYDHEDEYLIAREAKRY